ncbi:MAG TPA: hypothetical protein VF017_03115 [Thermoanaerobaculia bacterium]|nr:hypothetical protein [Thermoanaerobaculia bacterium]
MRALLGLVVWSLASSGAAGGGALCPEPRPLTFFGADTAAGSFSYALEDPAGTLVLITVTERSETARALDLPALFAGSVGAGSLFAWQRCGEGCVEALRLEGAAWRPLGQPLAVANVANLTSLYDRSGSAWLVVHSPAEAGWVETSAWRFEAGAWVAKGQLPALAVGSPAALPAPEDPQGVVSGSARFSAQGPPTTWAVGLPRLPEEKEGSLYPLGPIGAVYVAADGDLYLSPDRGATWQGSRWRPWGIERTEIWTFGTEFDLDVPNGTLGAPLGLAWWDRRPGKKPTLFVSEIDEQGRFRLLAEVPLEVAADTGTLVELTQLARTGSGRWLFLSDCFSPRGSPGVGLRAGSEGGFEPARFVPIER